ncbi:hypothetical protein [Enterococcus sp. AZ194]|uniref:hypothetical protein n=1 Tax=Enterococcus sp. AZ194 TaxID=2774629 RepID=UPI003F687B95
MLFTEGSSYSTTGWKVPSWNIQQNSADTPPYNVAYETEEPIALVPYGGAKLRITEFPTIEKRK